MDMSQTALSLYDANSQRLYLNQDERCRFRHAAEKQPAEIRAFALTLFFTGYRISEACGLRALALQVASRTLSITCLKKRQHHAVRELPIPTELSSALIAILPLDGSFFWTVDGEKLPRITAYRWIKTITGDWSSPLKWSTNWDRFVPQIGGSAMAGKRERPKDIVSKLRQVEVLQGQG
ncbi:MAG: tyrosine-type recombinase/integrase, partial [Pseudomonadota bacterium]